METSVLSRAAPPLSGHSVRDVKALNPATPHWPLVGPVSAPYRCIGDIECRHLVWTDVVLCPQVTRWGKLIIQRKNSPSGRACGESKRQNSHASLLDLTCLIAATDLKAPIY